MANFTKYDPTEDVREEVEMIYFSSYILSTLLLPELVSSGVIWGGHLFILVSFSLWASLRHVVIYTCSVMLQNEAAFKDQPSEDPKYLVT